MDFWKCWNRKKDSREDFFSRKGDLRNGKVENDYCVNRDGHDYGGAIFYRNGDGGTIRDKK